MKKAIIPALVAVLVALLLVGCAPEGGFRDGDTVRLLGSDQSYIEM